MPILQRISIALLIFGLMCFPQGGRGQAPSAPQVSISAPSAGQALQGSITITGSTAVEGFRYAELYFGYKEDPTQTWFFITDMTDPVQEGKLAVWDTSTLTDGDYTLRLVVTRQDGSQATAEVSGLRLRNYTPVETNTPTPPLPTANLAPVIAPATAPPTRTPLPITPTPLPPNPAQVTSHDVTFNLLQGVLAALALFILIGLYFVFRVRNTDKK